MDNKFKNLTLHLHELKYNCPIEKTIPADFENIYEEMHYLNELTLLGISEKRAVELHDKYKCSYEHIATIASRGYAYDQIDEILRKGTFNILETLNYSNSKHDFSGLKISSYKISGGNITGPIKEPKFNLKIVRI